MRTNLNKKYIPSYFILFIGFLLSCLIFFEIRTLKNRFNQYKFKKETKNYLNIINLELKGNIDILNSLENFFIASKDINRTEFKSFTKNFLEKNEKIQALSWVPLVNDDEREKYKKLAKEEGYSNFEFTEIGNPGELREREEATEYYPVYYIEPLKENKSALGFDLFSNQDRSETILKALKFNEVVGTSKIKLVQEKEEKYAFLLLNPVYKKNINFENELLGFISGVFKIDYMIESIFKLFLKDELDFYIYDATNNENTEIYKTKDYLKRLKIYEFSKFYSEDSIEFPHRNWKIRMIPGKEFQLNELIKLDWIIFTCLNIITMMFSYYIYKKIKYANKIEDLMKKDLEIQKKLKLSAKILENTPEGVMVTNRENKIISVNDSFLKTTGYLRKDIIGYNPDILSSNHHTQSFYKEMWNSLRNEGYWQGEVWNRKKNGEIYPEWLNIITIRNDEDSNIIDYHVGMFSDLSNQEHVRKEIQRLAYYDSLTDLPNRALFESMAKSLMINANMDNTEIAFVFLGLDRFKNINDALGRFTGDKLLKEVTKSLKEILTEDEIIARLGGDEFTILIPSFGFIDDLKVRIEKILDVFKYPFNIDEKEVFITTSMGISQYPLDGKTLNKVLENASTAMYFAKRSGRDNYKFYTENMNSKFMKNLDLENKMRKALKENEFFLEYQPQVSTITKKIISCEALVRWESPEFGIISPNEFISIAEDSGLILPLTRWILEKVFYEVKKVSELDPNIYISVNISGYQIKHGNLLEMIEEVLGKENINLKNIELELTESMLMEDISKNIETMSKLKDLKLKLAIDDFGTGYSSLSYIKKFPIDKLKIDKSFVDGIPNNEEDNIIVKTIISMAHNLGFKVTAEGVETKEQFDFLRTYKCDEIQGYYFSKPVSIEKIQEYLKENTFNL